MSLSPREDLYSKTMAESITTPPLLIVFYRRHSTIDPLWHVRHLGKFSVLTKKKRHDCLTHWLDS